MTSLTVLVPTRDRPAILDLCLKAIDESGDEVDVVVVDDGSTEDGTRERLEAWSRPPRRRHLRQAPSKGPAAARNLGLRHAATPWCLIVNDDTILQPGALRQFLEYRTGLVETGVSIIGNIKPWPDNTSPFEHWCSNGGSQFSHERLPPERHRDAGADQFVTANILVERDLLLRYPFDESFRFARYEDRELGHRLQVHAGHRIHYLPGAVSYHLHRLRFREWLLKWDAFAWSALHFAQLHPEEPALRDALAINRASERREFDFAALMDDVRFLNACHREYFAGKQREVGSAFRRLQEHARLTYLRLHQGLPEGKDASAAIGGLESVRRLAEAVDPEV